MEKIKPCSINHTLLFIYECTPGVFLRPGCDGAVTQCSLPPWSLLLFAGWRKIVNWNSGRGPSGSARDRRVSWNQKASQLSTGRELAETWNSCSVSADGNRKDVKESKTTTTNSWLLKLFLKQHFHFNMSTDSAGASAGRWRTCRF